jgi:hypothetical protein
MNAAISFDITGIFDYIVFPGKFWEVHDPGGVMKKKPLVLNCHTNYQVFHDGMKNPL